MVSLGENDFHYDWRKVDKLNSEDLGIYLVDRIREGITLEAAKQLLAFKPNLNVIERSTGFTVFHISAAVGRRDLFDLFRESANPDYLLKSRSGWTVGDLAGIVAQDFELVDHITQLEGQFLALRPS